MVLSAWTWPLWWLVGYQRDYTASLYFSSCTELYVGFEKDSPFLTCSCLCYVLHNVAESIKNCTLMEKALRYRCLRCSLKHHPGRHSGNRSLPISPPEVLLSPGEGSWVSAANSHTSSLPATSQGRNQPAWQGRGPYNNEGVLGGPDRKFCFYFKQLTDSLIF